MANKAEAVLENIRKDEINKIRSTTVEKDIELTYDIGNLLATDLNPFNEAKLKDKKEYLKQLARDNTQLLLNQIWQLETERVQDAVVAKLPAPVTVLPREKSIPKPKPLTKWQEYAKLKNVQNRKKGRMVYDEKSKSWKPRWGYKRANDDTKEWVLEVPGNADPNEDQFEKRMNAKKERVAKNELQRLRNIARRTGKKVPGIGATKIPDQHLDKNELAETFHQAKRSTASMGAFEPSLKHEKPAKKLGAKRKFDPVISSNEKDKQLKLLKNMFSNNSKLDVAKATNLEINQTKTRTQKRSKGNNKSQGKKGGKGKRKR